MSDELALLLRFVLLVWGITYVTSASIIFRPIRVRLSRGSAFRAGLLYCSACTGFWVGGALALGGYWPWMQTGPTFVGCLEAAIAAMVFGILWTLFNPGNPAWGRELGSLNLDSGESNDD